MRYEKSFEEFEKLIDVLARQQNDEQTNRVIGYVGALLDVAKLAEVIEAGLGKKGDAHRAKLFRDFADMLLADARRKSAPLEARTKELLEERARNYQMN